jgi:hypothetical protein
MVLERGRSRGRDDTGAPSALVDASRLRS